MDKTVGWLCSSQISEIAFKILKNSDNFWMLHVEREEKSFRFSFHKIKIVNFRSFSSRCRTIAEFSKELKQLLFVHCSL